jgi:hypothetical protein
MAAYLRDDGVQASVVLTMMYPMFIVAVGMHCDKRAHGEIFVRIQCNMPQREMFVAGTRVFVAYDGDSFYLIDTNLRQTKVKKFPFLFFFFFFYLNFIDL